ncbi:class I SAM-dependent methyltransferase [Actinophytocola glycyrrhizae]|uniref:Class I SAM-dependent methyltransferase n=1 Tax=Actinophytocola glycyrrhizae TaxID=2044873 RepID=A0ABV9S2G6_9PSEU
MSVPARLTWALSVVDPAPTERVVELGCGPGVAAALVCERLTTGHLVAVDRSATAVARTTARNTAHVEAGRLSVVHAEVAGLALPPASAAKVFAVNVNLFWTRAPTRELAVLRAILEPGGALYVLYGNGPTGVDRVTPTVADALRTGGFRDVEVLACAAGLGVRARG